MVILFLRQKQDVKAFTPSCSYSSAWKRVFLGELRNIIRFSSKIFLISRHEDEEDYNVYMKIFFISIKMCFQFVSWFRLCREKTRNKFEKKQEKQTMDQAGLQCREAQDVFLEDQTRIN